MASGRRSFIQLQCLPTHCCVYSFLVVSCVLLFYYCTFLISQDFNVLSVIEYAVKVLKVRHILVVGHDNCGGVKASMGDERVGLVDNWLTHIRDVRRRHAVQLSTIDDFDARMDRLVQLNVLEQVHNVCSTTTVQSAWNDGQPLSVHGWIYRLSDGLIRDLGFRVDGPEGIDSVYRTVAPRPPAGKGVAAEV